MSEKRGNQMSEDNELEERNKIDRCIKARHNEMIGDCRKNRETQAQACSLESNCVGYSYMPYLNDEVALLILARVPRSEYPKLALVNKCYRSLVKSGELHAVRKRDGIKEPTVLIFASGEPHWWSYDPCSGTRRNLPMLPCDSCFSSSDKETLSVGTQLLVSGTEIDGPVIWTYDLELDGWLQGPSMITPRSLFASANCGKAAYVAGGVVAKGMSPMIVGNGGKILNSAERYDPESKSWSPLPRMNIRRKLCAGCYMDGKFYVIGGQNENCDNLTCGEFYDAEKNSWQLIPFMLKDAPSLNSRSPPLVAVVNNELYSLEASSNHVKVYQKKSNSWKDLGKAPVRADHSRGWGVAFKSLGVQLLLIGTAAYSSPYRGMIICTCAPDPNTDVLNWRVHAKGGNQWSSFIFNCSVMIA